VYADIGYTHPSPGALMPGVHHHQQQTIARGRISRLIQTTA
jgi:hypothetical protein